MFVYQFATEHFSVGDVQNLGEVGIGGTFTFAGDSPLWTPQGIEEVGIEVRA